MYSFVNLAEEVGPAGQHRPVGPSGRWLVAEVVGGRLLIKKGR